MNINIVESVTMNASIFNRVMRSPCSSPRERPDQKRQRHRQPGRQVRVVARDHQAEHDCRDLADRADREVHVADRETDRLRHRHEHVERNVPGLAGKKFLRSEIQATIATSRSSRIPANMIRPRVRPLTP